jgi:hypothetical protein
VRLRQSGYSILMQRSRRSRSQVQAICPRRDLPDAAEPHLSRRDRSQGAINPAQQRIFRDVQSYQPTLEALNQVDADALTFEICSSGTGDLEAIGRIVTDKKVVIGVIDHHTLQIERPDQVADIVREALRHTSPERMKPPPSAATGPPSGCGRRSAGC